MGRQERHGRQRPPGRQRNRQDPAFQGPDGKFSEPSIAQFLAQRGLTDAAVRKSITQGLIARQVLSPVAPGAAMPPRPWRAMPRCSRKSAAATSPSCPRLAFAPKDKPAMPSFSHLLQGQCRPLSAARAPHDALCRDRRSAPGTCRPSDADIAARYKAKAESMRQRNPQDHQ
jgi:peptidyl-prolyl cis-trans isomerase D